MPYLYSRVDARAVHKLSVGILITFCMTHEAGLQSQRLVVTADSTASHTSSTHRSERAADNTSLVFFRISIVNSEVAIVAIVAIVIDHRSSPSNSNASDSSPSQTHTSHSRIILVVDILPIAR